PAFYASSLATRPAASFVGRIFIDSDNPSTGLYRDTGTAWVQIADPGAGTTGTLQQVTTNGNSTTTGITITTNGLGIGTTIPASNRLDIHSGTGLQATFNGTGVTNAALQFQLAGTGKWNVGNLYNSNSNDFIITDVVNTLNRVTVKNTGQTFIGADTTSSGLLVVNNSSSDSHIVVLGANSPSIRIRDSGSSLVQNVGLGISTGTNAFIQGSASGNYCIFNSSTTASPILFGVYDAGAGNTQEAARISAARNFLIGLTIDGGQKLQVNGNASIQGAAIFSGSVTTSQIIVNAISSITYGSFNANTNGFAYLEFKFNSSTYGYIGQESSFIGGSSSTDFSIVAINNLTFNTGGSFIECGRFSTSGNLLIGTTTDGGQKLQVNGTGYFSLGLASNATISAGSGGSGSTLSSGSIDVTKDIGLAPTQGIVVNNARILSFTSNGIITSTPTYNNTTGIAANVQIDSNGYFARSTVSSLRFKENINDWNNGLDVILALKPKLFNYKKDYYDKADIQFLGLIAEEVAEVCPYLADYQNEDRTGQVENVRYANIVVPLIKAIQELNNKINALKN
ncbi:MAG: tail fiber domain-containing protein, partial [Candidatus Falkowbacteria bacterium]|nr:tail fiber domain-containing protein [Candidatus Falkowbacteria bacterium]